MIDSMKTTTVESCVHMMLSAVSPLQKVFDKPGYTHELCNRQALEILRNDGLEKYAGLLASFEAELNLGVYWADKDWKNINHYFEPCTHKGLWNFNNAIDTFEMYYQHALQHLRQHNIKKSVFYLGAAAHLLQDLCVPHHARAKLLNGHKAYELWVQARCAEYAVSKEGIYQEGKRPAVLSIKNAEIAADFYDWVCYEGDEIFYDKVTNKLLPLAQRSTAGLFLKYAEEMLKLTANQINNAAFKYRIIN
ncbi:MAG: zinc dependent phospholipase C family protein [Acidaminococcaceae bacterium]